MDNNTTLKIILNGTVQGVGMRYFVFRNAKKYGITGYVKNKSDGSVECFFQGKKDVVESFLTFLKKHSPGEITDITKEIVGEQKSYDDFQITF